MAQAILWEMFPLRQRGMAMAVWGLGIMMAPIFGPTVGGWITDNWSWRWIFYINLPFGLLGFFLASAFLFDSPYVRAPSRVDLPGIAFMVVGFGCLQLFLDQGERQEWFDSAYIVTLALIAVVGIVAFLVRELSADEPMMDLSVFADRNFAAGSLVMAVAGFGFYASMLLLALHSQKVLSYDAWTSGLVLAPGGVGNLVTLFIAGRLVTRIDQRILLGTGIVLNATAFFLMSGLTPEADYWALAWPRFVQGLGMGFVFVPLQTLALATVPLPKLGHATAAFSIVRNIGGSIGIALATSMLAQRSQMHQSTLVTHVTPWSASTADHLARWTDHFMAQGADTFTAQRRALAILYRETVTQAQVLAYADEFRILAWFFGGLLLLLPLIQRVRTEPVRRRAPGALQDQRAGGALKGAGATESRHAAPIAE